MPSSSSHLPAPIRTASDSSASSAPLSSPESTTSSPSSVFQTSYFPQSSSATTPTSPTERSFFAALNQKLLPKSRSRSRSRSRAPILSTSRSASPIAETPLASPTMAADTQTRHSSLPESNPMEGGRDARKRTSTNMSEFDRMSYGRHSNDWLFNGLSVRESVRGLLDRKSSN
ncbi:hypothetical protein K402DRAFT_452659 [Aulographum hederae CBS 113979]|uniref:Uncharacterized protein n=1 Tax=Aulographum hederae CBS 113979 TaxID=1176131 RepID=A0A6G1H7D0_9PEZI|nr:hypothetical protein K402DRAFT_452659 [Aulographum hederae CBS 113979]